MKAKRILILIVCLVIFSVVQVFALSETVNFSEVNSSVRKLDLSQYHNSTSIWLRETNYGFMGSGDDAIPQHPSLEYPGGSNVDYLYIGSIWIGAKKYRRNVTGDKLYWVAQHPSADSSETVAEGSVGWNTNLKPVVDTLTTVGFDGDKDLFEFLPAYNPLESGNSAIQALYEQYNTQDKVMKSILSNPDPRPFAIPDPTGTYCFTIPTGQTGNESGFETLTGIYYDYSPFGTLGERDWGTARSSSRHIPLNIAVEQKSYAFPLENYDKILIMKYTLYNPSEIDTLFDLNIGSFIDNDCKPNTAGAGGATDDVSGYVMNGYEFAYSRDADGDNGTTAAWIGTKLVVPNVNLFHTAWCWNVGNGPNDWNPQSLSTGTNRTANEKYWLMTGRNPNTYKNNLLRGGPTGTVEEYEQSIPCDTRYLASCYASQPSPGNPNPSDRLSLGPHGTLTFFMTMFLGENIEELKQRSVLADNMIAGNFYLGNMSGLTSTPYLLNVQQIAEGAVSLNWANYTPPVIFELQYKLTDSTTEWQSEIVSGNVNTSSVSGLTNNSLYDFRVISVFNPGENEIRLQSNILQLLINNGSSIDDNANVPLMTLINQPNPYKQQTTIHYETTQKSRIKISIYNIKGQLVCNLTDRVYEPGKHEMVWNGKDADNKIPGSGIYFCVMQNNNKVITRKMLMMQ